nr:MAG TPA: hypothetical protein [Caudoviricetes sp.]
MREKYNPFYRERRKKRYFILIKRCLSLFLFILLRRG